MLARTALTSVSPVDDHLLAALKIGGNRHITHGQILDMLHTQPALQKIHNVDTGNKAAGGQIRHEQLQGVLPVELQGDCSKIVDRHTARHECTDLGANAGAGNGAHRDGIFFQHLKDADMRQARCAAATQRQHQAGLFPGVFSFGTHACIPGAYVRLIFFQRLRQNGIPLS